MRRNARHWSKGRPVRGLPRAPRGVPEEDLRALEAVALCEPCEPARLAKGWPAPYRGGRGGDWEDRRGYREGLEDWLSFLREHGVSGEPLPKTFWDPSSAPPVPAWVNDLADMVSIQHPDHPSNAPVPSTPTLLRTSAVPRSFYEARHAEAVRWASRAVRGAARSPLFRAALSAEAARLRRDVGATFRCHDRLLVWLRDRDWSDCRPNPPAAAEDNSPQADVARRTR